MTTENIEREFQAKVCSKLRLVREGIDRCKILTPFIFDDGDHLTIVLKKRDGGWLLSDEGHTYMHLSYDLDEKDLQRGTRQSIISNTLSMFSIEDQEGELVLPVQGNRYGDALYDFVQGLLRIANVAYLSRERIRSAFLDDFRTLVSEAIPEPRRAFDWHDPDLDPQGKYVVDCRINGLARPAFVFALPSDDRTRDATIAILQFERWKVQFHPVAIFEDQETVGRRVVARLSDVVSKQFSSLSLNRDRIVHYLQDFLQETGC